MLSSVYDTTDTLRRLPVSRSESRAVIGWNFVCTLQCSQIVDSRAILYCNVIFASNIITKLLWDFLDFWQLYLIWQGRHYDHSTANAIEPIWHKFLLLLTVLYLMLMTCLRNVYQKLAQVVLCKKLARKICRKFLIFITVSYTSKMAENIVDAAAAYEGSYTNVFSW